MTLKLFNAELSALYNFGLSDEVLLLRTHKMFSVEMRKISSILVKKKKKNEETGDTVHYIKREAGSIAESVVYLDCRFRA